MFDCDCRNSCKAYKFSIDSNTLEAIIKRLCNYTYHHEKGPFKKFKAIFDDETKESSKSVFTQYIDKRIGVKSTNSKHIWRLYGDEMILPLMQKLIDIFEKHVNKTNNSMSAEDRKNLVNDLKCRV